MILLDVAMGPVYAVMGGMLFVAVAVVAALVFVAVKLIQKAMKDKEK